MIPLETRIINKYTYFRDRKKIEKKIKYEENYNKWDKKEKKIKYEFYTCDYCDDEIQILEKSKKHEMSGGLVEIPASMTGKSPITLILCNKCLNPALQEFERERNGENHIPTII